jgi:hypothetical protein
MEPLLMGMDLAVPSQTLVSNMIYALYGVTVPSMAVWSAPVAYAPILEDTYQRDTAVALTMPPGSIGVTGGATIRYSRISLATLDEISSAPMTMEATPFTTEDLLPQINYTFGTDLTLDDVVNATYENPLGPFPLTATAGSFAWKGMLELDVEVGASTAEEDDHHSS